jgi:phage gp36-like protein
MTAVTVYATADDMEARFGEAEMEMLADSSEGAVTAALEDATQEAETYVSVNYTPPLPQVPRLLTSVTCDIARYKLYTGKAPEQVKERYEAAVKWLTRLADGKVKLTFSPELSVEDTALVVTPPAPAVGHANGGIFSDSVFDRLPIADPEMVPRRMTW